MRDSGSRDSSSNLLRAIGLFSPVPMPAGNPAPGSPDSRPHPRIGAGVKSTDLPGFLSLAGLCAEGVVGHLQVLLYPESGAEARARLEAMAAAGVAVILHAPHHLHGVNLSAGTFGTASARQVEDAMARTFEAADLLRACAIVLHAGEYAPGRREEAVAAFSEFLDRYRDPRFLLENLPPHRGHMQMLGCTAPELQEIASGRVAGFCLDFAHLHCTASASAQPFRGLLAGFGTLPVRLHHLSGTPAGSTVDRHLPLDHPENGLDLPAVMGWIRAHPGIPTSLELHGAGSSEYRTQAAVFARLVASL